MLVNISKVVIFQIVFEPQLVKNGGCTKLALKEMDCHQFTPAEDMIPHIL